MPNKLKKYPAFTLVELLIVIGIIGIMSVVGIVSLNSGKSQLKLQSAQREVAATIKLAQSYTLQGKTQNGATPCGYGFRFSDDENYEIFYNPSGLGGLDCSAMNSDSTYRQWISGSSSAAESNSLKNDVRITNNPATDVEMYFTVPHAGMYDNSGSAFSSLTLNFDLDGVSKSMIIGANAAITEN